MQNKWYVDQPQDKLSVFWKKASWYQAKLLDLQQFFMVVKLMTFFAATGVDVMSPSKLKVLKFHLYFLPAVFYMTEKLKMRNFSIKFNPQLISTSLKNMICNLKIDQIP